MPIDDESKIKLESYRADSEGFVGKEAFNAAVSMLPVIGAPVLTVMYDLSYKRMRARILDVLEDFDKRLRDRAVDRGFFKTEEFQNLLFLAIEQLRTSNDEEKKAMLAAGLANSCTEVFALEARKELFLHILRNLSLAHIQTLKKLFRPLDMNPDVRPVITEPRGEELSILQHLTANGLVEQYPSEPRIRIPSLDNNERAAIRQVEGAIETTLDDILTRNFKISQFGIDFPIYFGTT